MPHSYDPPPLPEVLEFLRECQADGFTPSTRELGAKFGKSDMAARWWIRQLTRMGHVARLPGSARRLQILTQTQEGSYS